jgi:gliding motility-associated-like protein
MTPRIYTLLALMVFGVSSTLFSQAPVANFNGTPVLICQGGQVNFFDLSTNNPTSWNWSFPGGNPVNSTAQNPTVTYPNPGVYTVTLTVSNGSGTNTLTQTNYITVNAPPTTSNAGPDQNICQSSTTLAANTPTIGTGAWTVVTGGGVVTNPNQANSTITNLSPGPNVLIWNIANDPCPASADTVRIFVDSPPSPAQAGPDIQICAPSSTTMFQGTAPVIGTGNLTLIGGTGTIISPNNPTSQVTGLSVGNNTFVWTTSNGVCPSSSDTMIITVLPAPNVQVNPPSVFLCIGNSFLLNATGASTYSWSPSSGLSATTGSSVSASPTITTTYTVVGTDPNGCTNSATTLVTVTPYPTVTVSMSSTNVCDNAPMPVTASGATTYSWAPSTGLSSTVGTTVNALPTSTITYTVTGSTNGCTGTATFTLTPIPSPTATVTPTSAVICQGNNVNLTGGGGVSYNWFPSTGLSATTGTTVNAAPTVTTSYGVIAIAANGCSDTAFALILVNPPPNVSVTPNNPLLCTGDTLTMTASGAINYTWSPSFGLSATTGSVVLAYPSVTTTYTVIGSATGCPISTASFTITVGQTPYVQVTPNQIAICQGSFTNLTASGANTYTWSPGTGLSSTVGTVVTANPTTATTYTVTGTASNGCTATAMANVNVNPLFLVSTNSTPAVCGNSNSGTATATTNGGSSPFTYQWSDPFSQTTQTAVALVPGTYTVTVTDANGCSTTQIANVGTVNTMNLNVSYTNPLCASGNSGSAMVSVSGGSAPYTYLWNSNPAQVTPTASNLSAGTYTVTVTDSAGCSQNIAVTLTSPSPIVFTKDSSNTSCKRSDGFCRIKTISGGTAPFTYQWSNGKTSSSILNVPAGTYSVLITDFNGCVDSAKFTLTDITIPQCVTIPNAFSPNGDGIHDFWVIENLDYYTTNGIEIGVEVYNRWGNLVYKNDDYKNDWDGTEAGKKLPGGVYMFVLRLGPNAEPMKGTFTILR